MAFFIFVIMSTSPIGIFDSGIGGTSIFKEIHRLLPNESIIYLADSKNAPYGDKSRDEILALSIKNTELLLDKNCKIIVVACNTATTNAIKTLRQKYPNTPFIGIEPAIKPAALNSNTKTIGILATKGTLSSGLFSKTAELHTKGIKCIEQIGEGLVPLIEENKIDSTAMKNLLTSYLDSMIAQNIDYLFLWCSHYPYLIPEIKKIIPNHIKIIDSGEAVAKQTRTILDKFNLDNKLNNNPDINLFTNLNPTILNQITDCKFKVSFLEF